jgi:redox-sensitive bicupin YhaK (pirin superfamily)
MQYCQIVATIGNGYALRQFTRRSFMSITLRPASARGHEHHGWLNSKHSFSFGHYYDPAQMGFRSLRVINEDVIDGGSGFPPHPHRDMEIVSYVVEGALAHRDTTGSAGVIRRGDVQAMSAGTGVRHSEYNDLADKRTRFLQIWILPDAAGLAPRYADVTIPEAEKQDALRLIVGPNGSQGALNINQDARIYASLLAKGKSVSHQPAKGRGVWVQLIDGEISVNDVAMISGDGAAIEDAEEIVIAANDDSEFLLFDLA